MTVLLAAAVIEGVVVNDELVSGVECECSIVEGVEIAGEVTGD